MSELKMLVDEIIRALKVLPENDCDLETIAIFLNLNYSRCSLKYEKTIFQNDIREEINLLMKEKKVKKRKRKIFTVNNKEDDFIPYEIYFLN